MASIIKITSRSKIAAGAPEILTAFQTAGGRNKQGKAKWCSFRLSQFPLRDFQKVLHNTSYISETSHTDTSRCKGDWEIRVFYLDALTFMKNGSSVTSEEWKNGHWAGNQHCLPEGRHSVLVKSNWRHLKDGQGRR